MMEFNSDWLTMGRHRVRLRSRKGFPTETMRNVADVARHAIDNNMSARARLIEIANDQDKTYDIVVGTTLVEDRVCVPQLEMAIATVLGLLPHQINILMTIVSQEEIDLHFGVYERMLAEKAGVAPPIQ
jgi:hypothetical protein